MSLHDKTHLAAHMEGAQLFTDSIKANQKVDQLTVALEQLKVEAACNHCGKYHGKEVCASLTERIAELEVALIEHDNGKIRCLVCKQETYVTQIILHDDNCLLLAGDSNHEPAVCGDPEKQRCHFRIHSDMDSVRCVFSEGHKGPCQYGSDPQSVGDS